MKIILSVYIIVVFMKVNHEFVSNGAVLAGKIVQISAYKGREFCSKIFEKL